MCIAVRGKKHQWEYFLLAPLLRLSVLFLFIRACGLYCALPFASERYQARIRSGHMLGSCVTTSTPPLPTEAEACATSSAVKT